MNAPLHGGAVDPRPIRLAGDAPADGPIIGDDGADRRETTLRSEEEVGGSPISWREAGNGYRSRPAERKIRGFCGAAPRRSGRPPASPTGSLCSVASDKPESMTTSALIALSPLDGR